MIASSSRMPAVSQAAGETVYDLISGWAMHASHRRLATWVVGGTLDAIGIALVLPGIWLLALPLVSIASIGAWGLAAQKVRLQPPPTRLRGHALRMAMVAAVAIGTVAAVTAFYGVFLWLLDGRWGSSGG